MELKERVEKTLNELRPFLEADGGNISLIDITPDNVVKVKLLGACSNCHMSMMTLKSGVEALIKRDIPEITAVEAV